MKRSRLSKVRARWKIFWTQSDYDDRDISLTRNFSTKKEMEDWLKLKKHSAHFIGKSVWDVKRMKLKSGGKK